MSKADSDAKKRTGRPAKYGDGPRATQSLRLRAVTREKLAEAAAKAGRSISEEIEFRLDRSFELEARYGGPRTDMLARLVGSAVEIAEAGSSWDEDETTKWRCRKVAVDIINVLMGGPPNRLILAANDPERAKTLSIVEDEARAIAARTIHDELVSLANRPPVVQAPSIDRVLGELSQLTSE